MPGHSVIIPVIPKTVIENSFLVSPATYETIYKNAVDVIPYSSIILMARLHRVDADADATVEIILRDVNPSPEDGQDFVDTSADFLSVTIDHGDSPPQLYKSSVGSNSRQISMNRRCMRPTAGPRMRTWVSRHPLYGSPRRSLTLKELRE